MVKLGSEESVLLTPEAGSSFEAGSHPRGLKKAFF